MPTGAQAIAPRLAHQLVNLSNATGTFSQPSPGTSGGKDHARPTRMGNSP